MDNILNEKEKICILMIPTHVYMVRRRAHMSAAVLQSTIIARCSVSTAAVINHLAALIFFFFHTSGTAAASNVAVPSATSDPSAFHSRR